MKYKFKKQSIQASLKSRQWLFARLFVIVGIILAGLLVVNQFVLPEAVPASSNVAEFSAERAMAHLQVIASSPRPVGSPGHEQTRDYLLTEIRRMGLEPTIQDTSTILRFPGSPGFGAGSVKNILVRLPGYSSTGAIALDAHYDGATTGPAAGDAGSGVITMLETLRVLSNGPQLKNDVIFVFADAEEVGDLGAHAFATQHPWMSDVKLTINYEAVGSSGPAYLYATSPENSNLIKAFSKAAPQAISNSFVTGLFGLFPEMRLACDLQSYMDEGSEGFGFVFSGNTPAYHTMLDNIESLDPGTVQQLGVNTLGLVQYFGNTDLGEIQSDSNDVFFTVWPGLLLHYPASWSLPLGIMGLVLLLIVIGFAVAKGILGAGRVVIAALVFLAGTLIAAGLTIAVWFGVKSFNLNLQVLLVGNWATSWFLAGILILSASIMVFLALLMRPRISFEHQTAGSLVGFSLLALLVGVVYPVGSYLFLWPVLTGVPALSWLLFAKRRGNYVWGMAVAILGVALPAIVLIGPIMAGANPFLALLIRLDAQMGMPLLAVDALFSALLTGLTFPLLGILFGSRTVELRKWWIVPLIGLSVAFVVFAIGWGISGFDIDHPRPEGIRYELDTNNETANWVTGDAHLGEWTSQFISNEEPLPVPANTSLLFGWPSTFAAAAPIVSLAGPTAQILDDTTENGVRTIRLLLRPTRPVPFMQVHVQTEDLLVMANVAGQPFKLDDYKPAENGMLLFNYYAFPLSGIELVLKIRGTSSVRVSLVDMVYSLPEIPGQPTPARPETTMPTPLGADCTVLRNEIIIPGLEAQQ